MENLEVNEQIKKLYVEDKLGSTTIAKIVGLSESTIRRRLSKMGIILRKPKKLDAQLVVSRYLEGVPIYVIAKELDSCEETISKLLKANKINIDGRSRIKFNDTVFDVIDTEEKAYWLGFIYADGYIATINPEKPNYAFEVSLKSDDFEHLNKLNSFFEYNGNNVKIGRINSKYERCKWAISNKHLWNTLNNYGCTPKKSLTLKFPNVDIFSKKELIRHFIRGYFDGDGGVSYYDKEHRFPTAYFCGTKDFLEELRNYIPINLDIHSSSSGNTYVLNTACRKAMVLLHYLYDDCSLFLDRKYNLFINFCRSYEESYESLGGKIGEDCDVNSEVN